MWRVAAVAVAKAQVLKREVVARDGVPRQPGGKSGEGGGRRGFESLGRNDSGALATRLGERLLFWDVLKSAWFRPG